MNDLIIAEDVAVKGIIALRNGGIDRDLERHGVYVIFRKGKR